jgi:hypothetical protein
MKYLILGFVAFSLYSFLAPEPFSTNNASTDAIIEFISSLSDDQKSEAIFDYEHEKRKDWHFLPEKSYPRNGLRLDQLSELQKEKVFKILYSSLSESGYAKTLAIIDLENVLADLEKRPDYRDPDLYSIAFYGDPRKDLIWSWNFGGHHLGLHFTYVAGKVSMSPRFFGANPAVVPSGEKKGLAVLNDEEMQGLALVNSLSKEQREKAIYNDEGYDDILTKNYDKVEPLEGKGIPASKLDDKQVEMLKSLINVYLSSIPKALADERLAQINEEDFGEILFAWAGATEQFKKHYYRVQGATFLIEFDNAQNNANHIHSVWRDFDGDFGEDLIREHRKAHKH